MNVDGPEVWNHDSLAVEVDAVHQRLKPSRKHLRVAVNESNDGEDCLTGAPDSRTHNAIVNVATHVSHLTGGEGGEGGEREAETDRQTDRGEREREAETDRHTETHTRRERHTCMPEGKKKSGELNKRIDSANQKRARTSE